MFIMRKTMLRLKAIVLIGVVGICQSALAQTAAVRPIFDAHIHYSSDAWAQLPPADAIAVLRKAGVVHALVSSSGDAGTMRMQAAAPDLIIPQLRPYRSRSELSTWVRDPTVVPFLEDRLRQHRYAAIGEFHAYGDDANTPNLQRVVQLAKQYKMILHAHSDAVAIESFFRQNSEAIILWAHSGFETPERVAEMLAKHKNLWADLAFRSDHAISVGGRAQPDPAWKKVFERFPERFMLGTDTYTPERWYFVEQHAKWSREWLSALSPELADKIALRNARDLLAKISWDFKPAQIGGLERSLVAQACDPNAALVLKTASGQAIASLRSEPVQMKVSEPFAMRVDWCGAAPSNTAAVKIDAWMPEHKHGMNYIPKVQRDAAGLLAEGFVMHMPGRWEFTLEVRDDAQLASASPLRARAMMVLR
jgi:Amidohydrolase